MPGEDDLHFNSSFTNSYNKELRFLTFFIAFLIRFILAIFFQDGVVFFDTGLDIFVNHSILYANTTLQSTFNYFPLAYLVTLPQIWLYYQQSFRNNILLRLMFKLPKIFADLVLAYLFNDHFLQRYYSTTIHTAKTSISVSKRFINNYELFILFNPINIYTSAMSNQIDMFPAILLVICWLAYKNEKYFLAGVSGMTACLIKYFLIFLLILIFISLLKKPLKTIQPYIIDNLIVLIPTIVIISIINFQGFLDHAILYQLFRAPIGSSISALAYGIGVIILPSSLIYPFQSIISISGFGIISIVVLFSSINVYKNPTDKNVIFYSFLSFLMFCTFNKVFWPQYLVPLLALWLLYRIENTNHLSNEITYWTISIMPIGLLYRSGDFATHTLVNLLGPNFFIYLLLIGIGLHIFLLLTLLKTQKINFRNRNIMISYFVILIFLISQICVQWYVIHLPGYTLQTMP